MSEQMTVNGMLILCGVIVVFWIVTVAAIRKHAKRRPDDSRRGRLL